MCLSIWTKRLAGAAPAEQMARRGRSGPSSGGRVGVGYCLPVRRTGFGDWHQWRESSSSARSCSFSCEVISLCVLTQTNDPAHDPARTGDVQPPPVLPPVQPARSRGPRRAPKGCSGALRNANVLAPAVTAAATVLARLGFVTVSARWPCIWPFTRRWRCALPRRTPSRRSRTPCSDGCRGLR